jgi:hypothetical protein
LLTTNTTITTETTRTTAPKKFTKRFIKGLNVKSLNHPHQQQQHEQWNNALQEM